MRIKLTITNPRLTKTYRFDTAKGVARPDYAARTNADLTEIRDRALTKLYPLPEYYSSHGDMLAVLVELERRGLARPAMSYSIITGHPDVITEVL